MPNIGPLEIAIVAVIVLIIFGPKRLPELGRSLGSGMRQFKASVTGEDREEEGLVQLDDGQDSVDEDRAAARTTSGPSATATRSTS